MKTLSLVSTLIAGSLTIMPVYAHGAGEDENHHLLNDSEQQVHHQVNDGAISPLQHQAIDQQLNQQHALNHGARYGGNAYYNYQQPAYNGYGYANGYSNYTSNPTFMPGYYPSQSNYGAGYGNQLGYGQHRQEHRMLRQDNHQVHDMANRGLISPLQHQQLDQQRHSQHDNMDGKHRRSWF